METWKKKAIGIGKVITDLAAEYPEIKPLATSWRNFSRKYRLARISFRRADNVRNPDIVVLTGKEYRDLLAQAERAQVSENCST